MSEKTKKIIKTVIFALFAALLLVDTFFLYIVWSNMVAEGQKPVIDSNILELQARVNCLENGEVWDDLVAEFEASTNESQTPQ